MGRLGVRFGWPAVHWVLPALLGLLLFVLIQPLLLRPAKAVATYSVGADVVNGYQQVYYTDGTTKTYITSGRFNHFSPNLGNNDWVTYVTDTGGATSISLFSISGQTSTTIANTGTNVHPKVDAGHVAWEKWVGTTWQIYLYNGTTVSQISSTTSSVRPYISGDYVAYATKNGSNVWEAHKYTLSTQVDAIISTGASSAWPRVSGSSLLYGFLGY